MAALIVETHSDGSSRRCDAQCHRAKNPECECICGGRYHGCAQSGEGPGDIVEAELLRMGEDPRTVDPELKRAVTERVLEQMVEHFERFKRTQDVRLRCRWTKGEPKPGRTPARGRTGEQLALPLL